MALFLGFHTNYNSLGTTIIGMNIFLSMVKVAVITLTKAVNFKQLLSINHSLVVR